MAALPLSDWQATRDTLQLWLQIIGKVRMGNTPLINHWWNVPLYVTVRGLTTSLMWHPDGEGFQIDVDLREHSLHITKVSGPQRSMPLRAGPVSAFYGEFMSQLDALGLGTPVWSMPVEIPDAIPFTDDDQHTSYEPDAGAAFLACAHPHGAGVRTVPQRGSSAKPARSICSGAGSIWRRHVSRDGPHRRIPAAPRTAGRTSCSRRTRTR